MALGTVIRNFAAPAGNSPIGLCWDGARLWNTNQQAQSIYQLDPVSGATIRTLTPPGTTPSGIAFDGVHLWHTNYTTPSVLYQLDMAGTVLRSVAVTNLARGVTWDGHSVYVVTENTGVVTQFDAASLASRAVFTMPVGARTNAGLCWDGSHFWVASQQTDRIYKMDVSGTVVTSFATPSSLPTGLAWDGRTLWHTDFNTDRIYQIMVN